MGMLILPVCIFIHYVYVWYPETRVTDSCESPCGYQELTLGPQKNRTVSTLNPRAISLASYPVIFISYLKQLLTIFILFHLKSWLILLHLSIIKFSIHPILV